MTILTMDHLSDTVRWPRDVPLTRGYGLNRVLSRMRALAGQSVDRTGSRTCRGMPGRRASRALGTTSRMTRPLHGSID